jgi:hypothetical protein
LPLLYDAYGRPINKPDTTSPSSSARWSRLRQSILRGSAWFQRLGLLWKLAIGLLGFVGTIGGLFWAWQQFRQELSVDPYISYDSKEAFQQQFTIANNGPFAIYDVHYTCAVTGIRLTDGSSGGFPDWVRKTRVVYVMMPIKPHLPILPWKGKTNTECDFMARFGPNLESADIEIDVAYKRWLHKNEVEAIGGRFSGKRDSAGNFLWVYGSNAPSPLEPPPADWAQNAVVLIPF